MMTRVLPAVPPTDHRLITLRSEIGNCDVLGFLQGARRVLLSGGGGGGGQISILLHVSTGCNLIFLRCNTRI